MAVHLRKTFKGFQSIYSQWPWLVRENHKNNPDGCRTASNTATDFHWHSYSGTPVPNLVGALFTSPALFLRVVGCIPASVGTAPWKWKSPIQMSQTYCVYCVKRSGQAVGSVNSCWRPSGNWLTIMKAILPLWWQIKIFALIPGKTMNNFRHICHRRAEFHYWRAGSLFFVISDKTNRSSEQLWFKI